MVPIAYFDLPSRELAQQQAGWLAPARARLLRRVHVARRRRVLDLGCGHGLVSGELARRSGGPVVAVDRNRQALAEDCRPFGGAARICADATRLPFPAGRFDLVFCQFVFLWLDALAAAREVHRVLQPGGVLVAIEPDYAGMIEHPAEIATRRLWLSVLAREGGDPEVGRKLPGLLSAGGFQVRVDLLDRLTPPSAARFDLLGELPLTNEERQSLDRLRAADAACDDNRRVVHLPMFLVTAVK